MPGATQSLTLSKRFYVPRCTGLLLGFVAVYANLPDQPLYREVLALLAAYCFGWPHAAYLLAKASLRPVDTERRSMVLDAFAAGFFAAAMGFNPIPSLAVVTMVVMNNMAMGGPRFAAVGLAACLLGAALACALLQVPFHGALSHAQTIACMPLLALYPLSLGYVCYLTAVKLQSQKRKLGEMSRTDYLTGLANRAALNDILEQAFSEPNAHLSNSVLALIDADGFKQINDRYGHIAGDRALQKISEIMRACVRAEDTVGRYGGDEFCVILRNVSQAEAAQILERMRSLAQLNIAEQDGGRNSTLSIGAAVYTSLAGTSAKWLHLADEAMYEAKRAGRNKVVFAG
jgi:diguanylate cyclase